MWRVRIKSVPSSAELEANVAILLTLDSCIWTLPVSQLVFVISCTNSWCKFKLYSYLHTIVHIVQYYHLKDNYTACSAYCLHATFHPRYKLQMMLNLPVHPCSMESTWSGTWISSLDVIWHRYHMCVCVWLVARCKHNLNQKIGWMRISEPVKVCQRDWLPRCPLRFGKAWTFLLFLTHIFRRRFWQNQDAKGMNMAWTSKQAMPVP